MRVMRPMTEIDKKRERFMVLNKKAKELLENVESYGLRTDDEYIDWPWGFAHPLYIYTLNDGTIYYEMVEATISIDGAPAFLTLLDGDKFSVPGTGWSLREIAEELLKVPEELEE